MKFFTIFLFLTFSIIKSHALDFNLADSAAINNSHKAELKNLTNKINSILPVELQKNFKGPILLKLHSQKALGAVCSSNSNDPFVLNIHLNTLKNPDLAGCMIREISRMFDNQGIQLLGLGNEKAGPCKEIYDDHDAEGFAGGGENRYNCEIKNQNTKTISSKIKFKQLVYSLKNKKSNSNTIDQSLQDLFVNYFEKYLLDPSFQCKKPRLESFFNQVFKTNKKIKNCNQPFVYLVKTNPSDTSHGKRYLNANRIYQAHYLLADKATSGSGGYGHSMIRLIVCAPDRKIVNSECLKDVNYHLVLSFRAVVPTLTISAFKGLIGSYTSSMLIYEFNDIKDEYTRTESRSLFSYPIKFNHEQLREFILSVAETFWDYSSQYYFINNNCATETLALIQTGFPISHNSYENSIMPFGVLDLLQKQGLVHMPDMTKEESLNVFFFPNENIRLMKITNNLKKMNYPMTSYLEYELKYSTEERKQIFLKYVSQLKQTNRTDKIAIGLKAAGSLQQLEQFYCDKERISLMGKVQSLLSRKEFDGEQYPMLLQFKENILKKMQVDQFDKLTNYRYGIPEEHDINRHLKEETPQSEADINNEVQALFPDETERLSETCNAVSFYMDNISSLLL